MEKAESNKGKATGEQIVAWKSLMHQTLVAFYVIQRAINDKFKAVGKWRCFSSRRSWGTREKTA